MGKKRRREEGERGTIEGGGELGLIASCCGIS
jgi:hypothetical protein